jgi:hypothetical protein
MKLGTSIIVIKADKKIHLEGKKARVISQDGNVFYAKTIDGESFSFDEAGRMDVVVKEITRADIAMEKRIESASVQEMLNEEIARLDKEITRLGYPSDEAYNDAIFAAKVMSVIETPAK